MTAMPSRPLGRSGLELSVLSLGTWSIGGWYWGGSDDAESIRTIREAIDLGVTAIDTAPVYGFGHAEKVLARALEDRRQHVLLMTKVGLRWDNPHGAVFFETVDQNGRELRVRRNGRPDSVAWEVERSLERLKVDTLDLVQMHWPDPEVPIGETMGALKRLREQGKLRAIGVCNFDAAQMAEAERALGDVPLASNQIQYSPIARQGEASVLPWAREHGLAVLAYSPLEQGLLTGTVDEKRSYPAADGRQKRPTFRRENRAKVRAALAQSAQPIAASKGISVTEVVLAWTLAQPGITSLLVGARRPDQIQVSARAACLTLTSKEVQAITSAFDNLQLDLTAKAPEPPTLAQKLRGLFTRK